MDDAVDASVSGSAETASWIVYAFAVAHGDEKSDDQLFEESRPASLVVDGKDAIQQLVTDLRFDFKDGSVNALGRCPGLSC